MTATRVEPLPFRLLAPCQASDGSRIVAAGGFNSFAANDTSVLYETVLALNSPAEEWKKLTVKLSGKRAYQAGTLLSNYLICLGGEGQVQLGNEWTYV